MSFKKQILSVTAMCAAMLAQSALAENLKPFILGDSAGNDYTAALTQTRDKLANAGFDIAGEYSPYDGATVIVVTNDTLKNTAAKSDFGGYGAMQRVAVTKTGADVQVSFTNPVYMASAYRMKGDLSAVNTALTNALGQNQVYGSAEGLSGKDLEGYHYMFGMPYFDDPDVLAKYSSFDEAVAEVEKGLSAGEAGVSKVYRIDIPGKKQAVFGVAMTEGMSSDKAIMEEIDFQTLRATAHLPYELLVHEDGRVLALSAKFRIAINFPDLAMTGKHSFMGIMDSPDAIKKSLKAVSTR